MSVSEVRHSGMSEQAFLAGAEVVTQLESLTPDELAEAVPALLQHMAYEMLQPGISIEAIDRSIHEGMTFLDRLAVQRTKLQAAAAQESDVLKPEEY